MRKLLVACTVFAGVALAALTARPANCAGECEVDRAVESLEALAGGGDTSVLKALYELDASRRPNMAAHWALYLAMQGDARFQRIHFDHFKTSVPPERQPELIESYQKSMVGPQKTCYLGLLTAGQFNEHCAEP